MLNIREDPTSNEAFQTVPPNKLADTIPEHPVLAHTISEHQDLHKTSSTTHVPYNASNQEDPPSNKGFQTVPSNILAVTTPEHPVLAHAISEHSIPTVDRNTTKRIVKLKPPTSKDNPKQLTRKRKEEKSYHIFVFVHKINWYNFTICLMAIRPTILHWLGWPFIPWWKVTKTRAECNFPGFQKFLLLYSFLFCR